ncbi:hypothetical protein ACVWY5_000238 [Bradyrhizobium sp. USDA 3256]
MTLRAALDQSKSPANDDSLAAGALAPTPPGSEASTGAAPLDVLAHAAMARWTGGLSPASLALAFADWQLHLAASPGKRLELALTALGDGLRFARMASTAACRLAALVHDQTSAGR